VSAVGTAKPLTGRGFAVSDGRNSVRQVRRADRSRIHLRGAAFAEILEHARRVGRLARCAQHRPKREPPAWLSLGSERDRYPLPPGIKCAMIERVDIGRTEKMLRYRVEVHRQRMARTRAKRNWCTVSTVYSIGGRGGNHMCLLIC
jgi:hypothetical protein